MSKDGAFLGSWTDALSSRMRTALSPAAVARRPVVGHQETE
jgi:hypothetical protein